MSLSDEPTAPQGAAPAGPPHRTGRLWLPAAFAAAIVASLWGPNLLRPPPAAWTSYASPKGQTRRVKLDDKSLLWMDGETGVRVVFDDHLRRAVLDGGEAELRIAANGRPFELTAGDRTARTRLADIDIARYPRQGVVVTLLTVREGDVEVGQAGGVDAPRTLHAGEEMRWVDGRPADPTRRVDPTAAFAWQTRTLVFAAAPLGEVAAVLNRYLDLPIVVKDPRIAALAFSGTLPIDREDRILRRLEAALPVRTQLRKDAAVLTLRPAPPAPRPKPAPPVQ